MGRSAIEPINDCTGEPHFGFAALGAGSGNEVILAAENVDARLIFSPPRSLPQSEVVPTNTVAIYLPSYEAITT